MINVFVTANLLLFYATNSIGQTGRSNVHQELLDIVASNSPEAVVQRQLDACNAGNIETFLIVLLERNALRGRTHVVSRWLPLAGRVAYHHQRLDRVF